MLEEIVKEVAQQGPFVLLLLYMWKVERDRATEERKENRELTDRVVKGLADAVTSVREVRGLVENMLGGDK